MDFPKKQISAMIFALAIFYLLLVIRTAWISDDAIITFRTVENFLAGYGLGYNPYVRVQSFTHPLWMLCIAAFYYVFNLAYPYSPSGLFTVVVGLSLLISFLTILILLNKISSQNTGSIVLAALMLSVSNVFIDFSTSGLENPLTHLLMVLFIWAYYSKPKNLALMCFLSGLIALNRLDLLLLIFPAILYIMFSEEINSRNIVRMFLGFAPLIVWEIFSVVYYGFPFPNTAYAKLSTGIDKSLLVRQGLDYLLNSVNWSPVTIFSVLVSLISFSQFQWKIVSLRLGIILYVLYVVNIGGDFMSGRFLSAPLLVAVAIISIDLRNKRNQIVIGLLVFLLGGFSIRSPLLSSNVVFNYPNMPLIDRNDIADERLFYSSPKENNDFVENGFLNQGYYSDYAGKNWRFSGYKKVIVLNKLGETGYSKGPNFYIIDYSALSDPLLARLPSKNRDWRVGHYFRDIPEGYIETLISGENKIVDGNLSLYYSKLEILITGPVFNRERFVEIWKFNTGQYNYLIEQ
jgi:arabinofuranosyltransferase